MYLVSFISSLTVQIAMGCIPSKTVKREMIANGEVSVPRKKFVQKEFFKNSGNLPLSPVVEGGTPPPWVSGHSKMTVEKDGSVMSELSLPMFDTLSLCFVFFQSLDLFQLTIIQ